MRTQIPFLFVIALVPALHFGSLAYWSYMAALSASCLSVCLTANELTLRQQWQVARPALIGGALTALLVALQLLPGIPSSLSYPIWLSAAQAMAVDLGNRISIAPIATFGSLIALGFALAAILTASLVSVRRPTAALLYRTAWLASILATALLIIDRWVPIMSGRQDGELTLFGTIVFVITSSVTANDLDPDQRLTDRNGRLSNRLVAALAVAISFLAFLSARNAAAIGLAITAAALAVSLALLRLPAFGSRASLIAALVVTALIGISTLGSNRAPIGLATSRGTDLTTISDEATRRMLADAPLLGTGGGTFEALARIYNQGAQTETAPPSSAAKLYVEYGRAGILVLLFGWLFLSFEFVAGALRRRRDRYISASLAALTLFTLAKTLIDASPSAADSQIILAVLIGTALPQRYSTNA